MSKVLAAATVVLAILKLFHVLPITWLVVFAPVLVDLVLSLVLLAVVGLVAMLSYTK